MLVHIYMISYVYSWCSPAGANSTWAAAPSHGTLPQCFLLGGAKPLNLRTDDTHAGMFWKQVVSTSCIKMTWPEKESKDKHANWHSIDIQLTLTHVDSCCLMLTCWSQVSHKDHFTKNQRTMLNSRDQWSHLLSQANLCGSIKNLRHRLLLASNGIGGNSLSALKHWKPTKHTAMELNSALKQSPKP